MKRALLIVVAAGSIGCPDRTSGDRPVEAAAATKGPAKKDKPLRWARSSTVFASPAFAQAFSGKRQVSISDIAERAVRSVVNVRTTKALPRPRSPFGEHPFFRGPSPYGPGPAPYGRRRKRRAMSLGSGVLLTKGGIVLTNHHVVKKSAQIRVTLSDGREFEATIVGSDPKSDLAVLQLKGELKNIVPLAFGDSNRLRLGEVVLAIGNPFGVGQTVTMGIVSAKGRANVGIVDYEDFIQTDAAINPGNSGGALVNMRGELIGINTAILSKSGGYQGIGFAIPSKMARPIMESLIKHGRVIRGWLGVMIQDLRKEMAQVLKLPVDRGVIVAHVEPGSPAEGAGLRRGDVLVAVDGRKLASVAHFRNAIANKGAKAKVKVSVHRGHKKFEVEVVLGELPSDRRAQIRSDEGGLGGLTLETLSDVARRRLGLSRRIAGVLVKRVAPGSAAAAAGLRPGDVIMEINRAPVSNAAQFSTAYRRTKGKLLLLIFRDGSAMYILLEK